MAEVNLFQKINFISHAGIPMSYKIECDGINKDEWSALAEMIMDFEKNLLHLNSPHHKLRLGLK